MAPEEDKPLQFRTQQVWVIRRRWAQTGEEFLRRVPVTLSFVSLQHCPCCGST
jgi:hypothetical protein